MSALEQATLSRDEARSLTDEVKGDAERLWRKLVELYEGGAHIALGYPSWGSYFKVEFEKSDATAYRLLQSGRALAQLPMGSPRPASERVARELTPLLDQPAEMRDAWAEVVELHPEPTAAQVREVVQGRRQPQPAVTPVAPVAVYSTIVADPPWQYDNRATRGAAEDHYPTLSMDELRALPVAGWADAQAHLYLWTTNGFLREAFTLLDAWGFTYKTTLVWAKPQIGLGNYFRSSTEYVLFGIKGGLRTLDSNQRNWFEAPRGKHSRKPALFFDLVEKVSPGPFLEMFARERRMGWDAWGNEA